MSSNNHGHTSPLYLWNGISLFWGSSFNTDPHKHDTLQVVISVKGHFKLKTTATSWTEYKCALIRAGQMHQMHSQDQMQIFIYLDAQSHTAQHLTRQLLGKNDIVNLNLPLNLLRRYFADHVLPYHDCTSVTELCKRVLFALQQPIPFTVPDVRIQQAIALIEMKPTLSVGDIARAVCLSESRLRHLFKQQFGQGVKSYLVWAKVIHSLGEILKGKKIIESCQESGFYDQAHMNKSYKTIIGVAPSDLKQLKDSGVELIPCAKTSLFKMQTTIQTAQHQQNIHITSNDL